MDIKKLQADVNERWSLQLNNPCHRSADANHALIHLTKALGKLASALNEAEHEQRALQPGEIGRYLADLVICAARFGDGVVDLDAEVVYRLGVKFPIVPAPKPEGSFCDAGMRPSRMDAPGGPECGCGQPAITEGGTCGRPRKHALKPEGSQP
jgi:hypothetical protein